METEFNWRVRYVNLIVIGHVSVVLLFILAFLRHNVPVTLVAAIIYLTAYIASLVPPGRLTVVAYYLSAAATGLGLILLLWSEGFFTV